MSGILALECTLKTIIYVDGFNFYKACLSGTPYKWLNVFSLFSEVVRSIEPTADVERVKYFTATVKGRYCQNKISPDRQAAYLTALEKHEPRRVEIIKGEHSEVFTSGKHVIDGEVSENWLDFCKMEEKQTDVNIALHMYRDCVQQQCSQVILVSNDSDLKSALELIAEDFPDIRRGLIQPSTRRLSRTLSDLACWTRSGISPDDLARHQFPDEIEYRNLSGKKTKRVKKPNGWGESDM